MSLKRRLINAAAKTKVGARTISDSRYRSVLFAALSLSLNLAYAVYHGVLGLIMRSWWFCALWAYYTILAVTRFSAVLCERRNNSEPSETAERLVARVCGALMLLMSCVLAGVNYMSLAESIAKAYGEITMISIAAYTFTKLTMAVIRAVKQRHNPSPLLAAIRGIGYAELSVSVLTMQRSMLISFGEMAADKIQLMNALTGTGVFLFILILGIITIFNGGKNHGKIKNSKGK